MRLKKEYLILIGIYIFLLIAFPLVVILLRSKNTPHSNQPSTPTITQYPISPPTTRSHEKISSYFSTVIGSTTENEIQNNINYSFSQTLPDGSHVYVKKSLNPGVDDEITTKNGVVNFEKAVTVNNEYIHPEVSTYQNKYGKPDKVIQGSKIWGSHETFYIYSSKGFTLIANPFTQEIDVIQQYSPTTVDNYIATWGSDIQNTPPSGEGFGQ